MLGIFVLTALIALGLFVYFYPAATGTETFEFTRKAFVVSMLCFAGSGIILKIVATTSDSDPLPFSILFEIVGWITLAAGLRGLFVMLGGRSRAKAAQGSSVPD